MTEEQKAARKKSAESGHIRWIKDHCLRDKDGDDDFVFISYKSDEYEKVLDDIVYNTCKTYGLRVYFDTAFDDASDLWIDQFYDNMCDDKCKAIISFISNNYYTSYATLMEVMASRTKGAGDDYDGLFFLPINLEAITECKSTFNTGLGTERFSDSTINPNAKAELKQFNELFNELREFHPELRKTDIKVDYKRYNDDEQLYKEKTETNPAVGKIYLSSKKCYNLMNTILPKGNSNDGTNKDFAEAIHDKLVKEGFDSVFGDVPKDDEVKVSNVPAPLPTVQTAEKPAPDEQTREDKPSPMPLDNLPTSPVVEDTEDKYYLITDRGVCAVVKYDNRNYTLLKNSRIKPTYNDSIGDKARKHFTEKSAINSKGDRIITEDITENKPSSLAGAVFGGSENGNLMISKAKTITRADAERILGENTGAPVSAPKPTPAPVQAPQSKPAGPQEFDFKPSPLVRDGNNSAAEKEKESQKESKNADRISGRISIAEFLDKWSYAETKSKNKFTGDSYNSVRLVGVDECAKYSTDKFKSCGDLVFDFVNKRIDEMGINYIETVNGHKDYINSTNPPFLPTEEAKGKKLNYKALTSSAAAGYSMNANYSYFNWIKDVLSKHIEALGLPKDKFYLEFEGNEE